MRPRGFGGVLLEQGDRGYDEARTVRNAMVDHKPSLIAQCETAADVQAIVRHGVPGGLELAVRGDVVDGALVLDLRRMNSVQIDPFARIARVGGGATWRDLDRAGQRYCLLASGGRDPSASVAGVTLGGGSGWLERKLGLASDALISVELVTADGRLLIADETRNTELFWALHGGGGNFGIATALTLRLTQVVTTTLALLAWPVAAGPSVVRAYRDLIESGAPDSLGGGVVFMAAPRSAFVPDGLRGQPVVLAIAVYAGGVEETCSVFAPMFALAPEGSEVRETPYVSLRGALDRPAGFRKFSRAEHLSEFPDPAVLAFCDQASGVQSASQQVMVPWGGAVLPGAGEWPQAYRRSAWVAQACGAWPDPCSDASGIRWARDMCAGLGPWAMVDAAGQARLIAECGAANYDRLARVKCQYDPENVFHLNRNVEPEWRC
jgi:FAD/FMN-containing dehydrogenase